MTADDSGVRMADINKKPITLREAIAEARVFLQPETITLIEKKKLPKGDVLAVAKCAGILAAKKVDELIPLCHPLSLEHVKIDFELARDAIVIKAACKTRAKTGVEMEAMTAASVSALTIYDMCKAVDRGMTISEIKLLKKTGGRSGTYVRKNPKS